jgi:dCMP deaminase
MAALFCLEVSKVRISRDEAFMKMAEIMALRSTCLRAQVGAIIVRDGRPISVGYNGPSAGSPKCVDHNVIRKTDADSEPFKLIGPFCLGAACNRSIHAEANAIAFAAKNGVSVDGCTMYCTYSPCINCAKLIVASGLVRLVYHHQYRDVDGLEFLAANGVTVEYISMEEET